MKLDITGASNFVNRMFEACGPFQWAREFLKNAQEAGATRVEFGIEWDAVRKQGVYRRTIADNGCGMSRDEIVRFFSKLGEGGKPIGGVHENFGVGAKIASLPWNPEGVVILSWKEGNGSMIWIRLDPDSGDYELADFAVDGDMTVVLDPDVIPWTAEDEQALDWSRIKPDWIGERGTVVILLGSEGHPDTVLGNPDAKESDLKGLSLYLNTRFWDLSEMEVHVVELSTAQKNQWPSGVDDDESGGRYQRRRALGARYYLTEVGGDTSGSLKAADVLYLDEERVLAEWYLWDGDRPHIGPYAKKGGYVAVRYKDELFHLSSGKVQFRWFGIIENQVQQRTTIILEPRHFTQGAPTGGKWGVHPDQSRNRLLFSGNGVKGDDVPLSDWGMQFAEVMPEPIREAILAARGDLSADIEDEDIRRRLQDKFGDRWTTRRLVVNTKNNGGEDAEEIDDEDDVRREYNGPSTNQRRTRRNRTIRVPLAKPGGDDNGTYKEVPVDVPRIGFNRSDAFEKPWHLALWAPNDPAGPTVYINVDAGILQDVVEYHQERYPEIYHEEVAKIVRRVFGEVAACKVAHSQKLTKEVSEQDLDKLYRSEEALTVALMGIIAEESLIAQRLGRLGPKKQEAA